MTCQVVGKPLLPFVEPSFAVVSELAATKFVPIATDQTRIIFPVSFTSVLPKEAGPGDRVTGGTSTVEYPKCLTPLGGHSFIYAWYLAMHSVLEANDAGRISALMGAARSVTILMFKVWDERLIGTESIRLSETIRSAAQVSTDNFLTFVDKLFMSVGGGTQVSGDVDAARTDTTRFRFPPGKTECLGHTGWWRSAIAQ